MTYHIHTEDRVNVASLVEKYFPDFTLTHGAGFWHGTVEPAAIIELVTDDRDKVRELAADLKFTNDQESVLIECSDTTNELI